MRMDPQIRARWVAALRSGKYPQAKGYLQVRGEGYCCLGVLCEIAVQEGVVLPKRTTGDEGQDVVTYEAPGGGDERVLPEAVAEWAGIEQTNKEFVGRWSTNPTVTAHALRFENPMALTDLNDFHEWDFGRIADAIEADAEAQS